MPTATTADTCPPASDTLASGIRQTLERVESLNHETAGFLKTLAFILNRVAAADDDISEDEVRRMESILVEHASLSVPEAVLTVEIARHCCEISDCARSYDASRRLRTCLNAGDRRRLRGFLDSVAEADGRIRRSEMDAIRQISTELGLIG